MSKLLAGMFFVMFAIMGLFTTKFPDWLLPILALLAGVFMLFEFGKNR